MAQKSGGRHHHPRALRRLHQRAAHRGRPVRRRQLEDRDRCCASRPIRLELQVPEVNAPQMKLSVPVEAMRSGLSRAHLSGPRDGHQSGRRSQFAHLHRDRGISEHGSGAEARHVRHRAHSAARQQHGDCSCREPRSSPTPPPILRSSISFATAARAWPWCSWAHIGRRRQAWCRFFRGFHPAHLIATDHLADLLRRRETVPSANKPTRRQRERKDAKPCIHWPRCA